MNVLLADQYVRSHTEALLAQSARSRQLREARRRRRGH